jgi:GNAT superfamily N-acetyltransferase
MGHPPNLPAMSLRYSVQELADRADLARVDDGIDAFNHREPELRQVRPLAVLARDDHASVVAGAVGRTWGECAELQQLWVQESDRRQGVGRRLMALFEADAAGRGCRLVYLDTFSFQAPGFYEKLGYRPVLQTRGFTRGIVKFTMHKTLGS